MQARLPRLLLGGLENPATCNTSPFELGWEHFHALQGISISAVRGRAARLTEPTAAGKKGLSCQYSDHEGETVSGIPEREKQQRLDPSRRRSLSATAASSKREKRNKTDIFRCVLCGTWVGTGNPPHLTVRTLWYVFFFFFNLMNVPHAQLFINWPSFAKRTRWPGTGRNTRRCHSAAAGGEFSCGDVELKGCPGCASWKHYLHWSLSHYEGGSPCSLGDVVQGWYIDCLRRMLKAVTPRSQWTQLQNNFWDFFLGFSRK